MTRASWKSKDIFELNRKIPKLSGIITKGLRGQRIFSHIHKKVYLTIDEAMVGYKLGMFFVTTKMGSGIHTKSKNKGKGKRSKAN